MTPLNEKAAPDDCSIENGSGEKCARAGIAFSVYDCITGNGRTQDAGRLFQQTERAGRRDDDG